MDKKGKIGLIAVLCAAFCLFAAGSARAELDLGVGADGVVVICSKTMSLRCGLGSKDAEDKDKVIACLDSIAAEMYASADFAESIATLRDQILHECNKEFIKLAAYYKSHAGDYEDKGKEQGFLEFKTDKHGKRGQEGQVSASNGQNVVKLTDLVASTYLLKALKAYFENLADRDISELTKENRGRASGE